MKKFRRAGLSSLLKGLLNITDNFTRANAASLGNPSGNAGATWEAVSGTWGISSNKAYPITAVSSNPVATLTFTSTSMTVSADNVGPGMGTAFWVTDANNWWATYVDVTQTCSTCYNAQNCASYSLQSYNQYAGYNSGSYVYTPTSGGCPAGWQSGIPWIGCSYGPMYNYNGCCCSYSPAAPYYRTVYYYSCASYNASTPYSCNCVNNYSVKLIKKIAGTVSQVASFAMAATVYGIQTVFNSATGGITVRAYSAANYTTQIGSDQSTTVSGYSAAKKHGVIATSITYAPAQTNNTMAGFKVQ